MLVLEFAGASKEKISEHLSLYRRPNRPRRILADGDVEAGNGSRAITTGGTH